MAQQTTLFNACRVAHEARFHSSSYSTKLACRCDTLQLACHTRATSDYSRSTRELHPITRASHVRLLLAFVNYGVIGTVQSFICLGTYVSSIPAVVTSPCVLVCSINNNMQGCREGGFPVFLETPLNFVAL